MRAIHAPTTDYGWPAVASAKAAVLLVVLSLAFPAIASQTVPRNLPEAATHLQPVDRLPASQQLKLAISLPLRNHAALTNLLQELYNPASPQYKHYLTSTQFAEMFGPTEEDYKAVSAFATAHNLKVTATSPNRAVLDVEGAVADIEQALHVKMCTYQHPTEARTFFAPDADPTLDLGVPVLAIHGLNNYTIPKPLVHKVPFSKGAKAVPNAGSGPFGTYLGYDFRDAYVPGVALTGAGQTVALFELDGYFASDPVQYEILAGLPNVPLQNVLLDGFNGAPGFANVEVSLDIEMAIAMAPGLSQVIVYEGFIPLDILNRIATDNSAKQVSASWAWSFDPATDQTYQQMAAQGQSYFNASGDYCAELAPNILHPSDDAYVISVGGTTLTTTGPGGSWVSEKVWNWGGGIGSSGGSSDMWAIPSWQQGVNMSTNGGSTTRRNWPDVALTADNIIEVADDGFEEDVGGTSCAAPLWAGFTALVNQQAALGGQPNPWVGFLNPAIYNLCQGPNYNANFHDIIDGNNTNYISTNLYYAFPGYDLCTGWGTPVGSNLLNTLAPPVFTPEFEVVTNIISGGNGNGLIDYDECDDLNVVIVNDGAANATTVSATLFTSTPGVSIAQNQSVFPDMPVGTSATNVTPFKISTTSDFNCGIPVHFTLIVRCDQTVLAEHFTMSSGVPGTPVRFDNSTPVAVPSAGTTNSTIVVSNVSFALNKLTVSLFLSDVYDQSMVLRLISPDGTTNLLSANNGSFGSDYGIGCTPDAQRCTFDDAAPLPVGSGAAPFQGTFQPQTPLSIFNGKGGTNLNGAWTLQVQDQFGISGSVLECWSLFVTPTMCLDGGGECPGADLAIGMTASPQPVTQGNQLTYTISVTNFGPSSASNVLVSQILPSSVTYVSGTSSQGSIAPSPGLVSGHLGLVRPGHTATMTIVVSTETAGVISSTASVTSEQPDFNLGNNIAIVVTHVNPPSADIAVSMNGSPSSTVVGGALTYNVTVANNGPNDATQVALTNVLPASMTILNATVSQGGVSISSNVITSVFGTILAGSQATAAINVTPTAEGTFVATARAGAVQPDPVPANNASSATVIVGPAADVALGLSSYPNPVVTYSNLNYVVTVTNLGPSTASGVSMSLTLPPGVSLVSKSSSPPVTFNSSTNPITANIGALNLGEVATVKVVVTTSGSGTLTASATVSGSVADPNLANNSATAVTTVEPAQVTIAPAGAILTYESGPVDGAVDPGESVSVQLFLENTGNVPTTDLVATLLATNGVTPSGTVTQTYGVLQPIGVPGNPPPMSKGFSFTAGRTNNSVTATLRVQDGNSYTNYVNFTFYFPATNTFSNTTGIIIPDHGPASLYPSPITVAGITNLVSDVSVTLSNFYHTYPHDVSVLLVGPGGQSALVMSHAGTEPATNLTLTLDDSAVNGPLPGSGPLPAGEWQPAAYTPPPTPTFSNPAPTGPFTTSLSAFNGQSPNGTWSLYVLDDSPGDQGGIANGWSLGLTTINPVNQTADLAVSGIASPNPCLAGASLTYVFTVTNGGPDTATFVGFTNVLPPGVSLVSAVSSQGSLGTNANSVFGDLSTMAAGATATVTVVVQPGLGAVGSLTNIATVTNAPGVIDLDTVGATAVVTSSVILPVADVGVSIAASTNALLAGSNVTYTVTVINNGPQNALNVVVTDPLPSALSLVSTSISAPGGGTVSNVLNTVSAYVGTLAPGSNATITITATAQSGPSVSNSVSVATASTDSNSANNSAGVTVSVFNPAANIIAAGARIMSKSGGANNGAVEPGDLLTMSLALQNVGSAGTTNLTATLLAGNGVVLTAGTQSAHYGALPHGGGAVGNNFTFTATGAEGGSATATLLLQDGANTNFAPVNFTFYFPATFTFSNATDIVIPDHGEGTPYPASINNVMVTNASGGTGIVTRATATLYRYIHTFPSDVSALLTAPTGNDVLLMNYAGGGYGVAGVTLTFDDAASGTLPNQAQITTGTYKPTAYQPTNLPVPAPSQPYGSALANFNNLNPDGTWSLYVFDDKPGDAGEIAGGWSLTLSVIYPLSPAPVTLSGLVAGGHFHLTVTGQPNLTYIIEATTNLAANSAWVPISTNVTSSTGTISIVDSNVFKYRFYRAVQISQ